ncbi:hypothetical protein FC07_GL000615 [Loigolactobacillus bifermentans DSM 20003]|uniref:Uncharacterized protein n=1 Tax=Loigolactobacillus bifermentans DSM 20003 TaxID=1423726 RepID=A0A0R1GK04_9LACO|nr:hypothetical protein FC07_GL000615 [Loigolactobacillus bifermentans DSM 20003]
MLPKLTLNIDFTKRFSTSDDGEHTVPKLLFTDSQNIQWRRLPNGHLEKCKYVNQLKKYGFSFTDAGSNQKHLDEVTD